MTSLTYNHFFILSLIVFIIGCFGLFLNRRNMILILMCIEIILLAANINFVSASVFLNDINGQVFSIFILTIKAYPGIFPNRVDTWKSRIEKFVNKENTTENYQIDKLIKSF